MHHGPSTDLPLFVCVRISLWKFVFFHVALFSCCTVFILHHFLVAVFCSNLLMLHFFPCCTHFMYCALFHVALLHVGLFSFCILLLLHSPHVATFFLLHFVHVALYSEVWPGPPQTSKMESFAAIINKYVKYYCKALHLGCLLGPDYTSTISMLHFFHIAPFMLHSFMFHFFNIEKYWKMNKNHNQNATS